MSLDSVFSRRGRVDGECMNAGREFGCEQLIYHAVAFQPGLSFEVIRYNINAEMRLSAWPVSGMALMLV